MAADVQHVVPCRRCGEAVAEGFDACWRCATRLPATLLAYDETPTVEEAVAADRAAATATSVALPSGPTERSLRPHVAAGLAGVVVHFVLMLRLPDLRAAAELGVVLTRPFWVQMLPSVVLAGVYVGSVAAWRAWRGRWRA